MQIVQNLCKAALACSMLAFAACNNSTDTAKSDADSTKMADSAKMATAPMMADSSKMAAAPAGPTVPFTIGEVKFPVKNYKTWKESFDKDSTVRLASGLHFVIAGTEIGTSNVTVVTMIDDIAKAKAFMSDTAHKAAMMKRGVIGTPTAEYMKVMRFSPTNERTWVEVRHKVKDYATWLKAFDAEGAEARAKMGLIDAVIAQSIDDPNMVLVVLDIKEADIAKAKAAVMSESMKKTMMDAGVIGKPTIKFYQVPL